MSDPITSFSGPYRFLSNFWPSPVELDGVTYPTVEHAYQAAKRDRVEYRLWIREASTPGIAKRRGRGKQGPDWHGRSLEIMSNLIRQKFRIPQLRQDLLTTNDRELIEGNEWMDRFWGSCRGEGENHLGRILMRIRKEIK